MNCWRPIKVGGWAPAAHDRPSVAAGKHQHWDWVWCQGWEGAQACTKRTRCQKARVNTSVCVCMRRWHVRFPTEDSISPVRLFVFPSICAPPSHPHTSSSNLPFSFHSPPTSTLSLQANSRLKQVEREYGQKLAKSAQVITSPLSSPPFLSQPSC